MRSEKPGGGDHLAQDSRLNARRVVRAGEVDVSVRQDSASARGKGSFARDSFTAECRICLQNERQDEMVAPCGCTGTMRYVHETCVLSWAKEKRSMRCELCHVDYAEPLRSKLEEWLQHAGSSAENASFRRGDSGHRTSQPDNEALDSLSWGSFWCHLLVLGALLAAILYLTVFSSSLTDGGGWMGYVWKCLIVIIPFYLVGRLAWSLVAKYLAQRAVQRQALEDAQQRIDRASGAPQQAGPSHTEPSGPAAERVVQQQQQQADMDSAQELQIIVPPASSREEPAQPQDCMVAGPQPEVRIIVAEEPLHAACSQQQQQQQRAGSPAGRPPHAGDFVVPLVAAR